MSRPNAKPTTGALLAMLALGACARGDAPARVDSAAAVPNATAPSANGPVDSSPPLTSLGPKPETTVQGVVDAINAADVRLASFGAQKGTSADVKRLAEDVGSTHRQKITDRPPIDDASPAGAATSTLRDAAKAAADRLAAMPAGVAFDRAWADAEVDVHERALRVLDRVAKAASAGDLPEFVQQTRAQVQQHLEQARALQARLR